MKNTVLAVLSLALLAAPALAQNGPEKLKAGAGGDFDVKLRFLKPASAAQTMSGSLFGMTGSNGEGGAGGLELEYFPTSTGGGLVVGLGGFGGVKKADFDPALGLHRTVKVFGGGPTIGYRQRLFRVGVGPKDGSKGVFLEPDVSLGLAPFSAVGEDFYVGARGDTWDYSRRWAPLTGYAAAGVNVNINSAFAFGIEARRYQDLQSPNYSLSTAGVKLTLLPGALK